MATCAVCGEEIAKGAVWVRLGDKGERAPSEVFALHPKHYPDDGKVEVQAPSYLDEHGTPHEGEKTTVQRYVKVDDPNG